MNSTHKPVTVKNTYNNWTTLQLDNLSCPQATPRKPFKTVKVTMLWGNFISLFLSLHQSHTSQTSRHLYGHTHCVSWMSCSVWIVASTSGTAVQWATPWGFSGCVCSFSTLVSASFFTACCVSSSPGWARVKRNRLPKRLKKPSTGGRGEQGSEAGGVMVGGSLSPWTLPLWSHTPSPSSTLSCFDCSSALT